MHLVCEQASHAHAICESIHQYCWWSMSYESINHEFLLHNVPFHNSLCGLLYSLVAIGLNSHGLCFDLLITCWKNKNTWLLMYLYMVCICWSMTCMQFKDIYTLCQQCLLLWTHRWMLFVFFCYYYYYLFKCVDRCISWIVLRQQNTISFHIQQIVQVTHAITMNQILIMLCWCKYDHGYHVRCLI